MAVHHVVVLEDVFADVEVVSFHAFLRALDAARDDAVLERLVIGDLQPFHHRLQAVTAEEAHEVVLHGDEEVAFALVALAARAAAELVVDAARFVAFRTDDAEAAHVGHAFAELDVGAATGHVRRDHHRALLAGQRHDLGFLFVLLGVEDAVRDALLGEERAHGFRLLDRGRTDEHGLAERVFFLREFRGGDELGRDGAVDGIRIVDADHRAVRGDHDDAQFVDRFEFFLFRLRRAGHAGELLEEAEVVLKRDRRERLRFALHLHAFLGFDGLVEAVAVAAARHEATRELVDDDHLAVLHHVIDVALVDGVRAEGLLDVVHFLEAFLGVDVLHAEEFFHGLDAFVGEDGGALLLVFREVRGELQLADEHGVLAVLGRGFAGGLADDERRAGFVDEDRVHFVDDRVVEVALHFVFQRRRHVVAQVVETEFVVGAVGDIAGVGRAAVLRGEPVDDAPDREAERFVEDAHPRRVALGEVVVDRHDVHAFAGERVEVRGQRGDERFTFAGFHFRDAAAVEDRASEQLHVERDHVPRERLVADAERFALQEFACADHDGERLGEDLVERCARGDLRLQLFRLRRERLAGERADVRGLLRFAHGAHDRPELLQLFLVRVAEQLVDGIEDRHGSKSAYPTSNAPTVPGNEGFLGIRQRARKSG